MNAHPGGEPLTRTELLALAVDVLQRGHHQLARQLLVELAR